MCYFRLHHVQLYHVSLCSWSPVYMWRLREKLKEYIEDIWWFSILFWSCLKALEIIFKGLRLLNTHHQICQTFISLAIVTAFLLMRRTRPGLNHKTTTCKRAKPGLEKVVKLPLSVLTNKIIVSHRFNGTFPRSGGTTMMSMLVSPLLTELVKTLTPFMVMTDLCQSLFCNVWGSSWKK